ncbi:hypothetical protein ACQPYE_12205 [Actinosynnema sp. CA-299493]
MDDPQGVVQHLACAHADISGISAVESGYGSAMAYRQRLRY